MKNLLTACLVVILAGTGALAGLTMLSSNRINSKLEKIYIVKPNQPLTEQQITELKNAINYYQGLWLTIFNNTYNRAFQLSPLNINQLQSQTNKTKVNNIFNYISNQINALNATTNPNVRDTKDRIVSDLSNFSAQLNLVNNQINDKILLHNLNTQNLANHYLPFKQIADNSQTHLQIMADIYYINISPYITAMIQLFQSTIDSASGSSSSPGFSINLSPSFVASLSNLFNRLHLGQNPGIIINPDTTTTTVR